jgi:hypothetical protein
MIDEISKYTVDMLTPASIFQILSNAILSGGIFYWIQRKHKINDDFIIEKNKCVAQKHITCESEIFDIMITVNSQYDINSDVLVELSNNINKLRMINYLYISESLLKVSSEFSDYLLLVSADNLQRNKFTEDKLIKKFKSEFKK